MKKTIITTFFSLIIAIVFAFTLSGCETPNPNESISPAVTYTVSFITNGGTDVDPQTVTSGEAITAVTTTKEGHTLSDWYTDQQLTQTYNVETPVTADITLYAKWAVNSYSVNYHTNGGNTMDSVSVAFNDHIMQPSNPTRDGYNFLGWYDNQECSGDTFVFPGTMPAGDVDLYADWEQGEYTMTFYTAGGSYIAPGSYEGGEAVSAPADPTRDYYFFSGWYTDDDYTTEYVFDTMPEHSVTVYARWEYILNTTPYTAFSGSVGVEITGVHPDFTLSPGVLSLPHAIDVDGTNYTVYSVGASAFSGKTGITSLLLTSTEIENLGNSAFSNCTGITSVTFSGSIRTIGTNVFNLINALTTVTIPEDSALISIGERAFASQLGVTSIALPRNLESLGTSAFGGSLSEITVSSLNTHFTAIDNVLYNKDVTELILYPRGKADSTYVMPSTVTSVRTYAMVRCQARFMTFSENLETIGDYAFDSASIVNLILPASVDTIGAAAFMYCGSLIRVVLQSTTPPSYSSSSNIFTQSNNILKIFVPAANLASYQAANGWDDYTEKLEGYDAYSDGLLLKSVSGEYTISGYVGTNGNVIIPDEYNTVPITAIGEGAFRSITYLAGVYVDASIEEIGDYAFYGASSLQFVTLYRSSVAEGNITAIGANVFPVNGSYWVYVYSDSYDDYKNAATSEQQYYNRIQELAS